MNFRTYRGDAMSGSKSAAIPKPSPSKTVLIVEDDALNLKMINDIIKSLGYKTIATRSGRQAVDIAFAHHPDMILLDMHLPDCSGLFVCGAIRADKRFKNLPIIAITALARAEDRQRALDAGCDEYLVKPVSLDRLIQTVAQRMQGPTAKILAF